MKKKLVKFVVEVELPEATCTEDVKEYIELAVKTECGCLNPETDPMFHLNRDSVKVMNYKG